MKKAEKMLKLAESGQQNLPDRGEASVPQLGNSSVEVPATASAALTAAVSVNSMSGTPGDNSTSRASVVEVQSMPMMTDVARAGSLERTHELVASHALRLQESGSDQMRVVIQPGDGIHLALEFKCSNGRIEAQALLQQGDFNHLSRHWAELQQLLEPRKIQLAALQQGAQTPSANSSFPQSQRRPAKDQPGATATADFLFGGSMTEPPANRAARKRLHRGWETWA